MRAGRDRDLPVLKALKARRRAHAIGAVAPASSNARHRRMLPRSSLAPTAEGDLGAGSSAACELAVIADRAGFDALEAEWNALFARAGRPCQFFQTFNWLWHWANHYLDDGIELTIVTGRCGGRLAIVWPLVATRVAGVQQLSWMGEPVSQYGDALVEEGPDAREWLRRSWVYVKSLGADIVHLRKVRSDAAVAPLLAKAGAVATDCATAPCLDLASAKDFETYKQRYSAKKRARRRRHLRSLQETGSITFEQHSRGPVAHDLVGHALGLKRAWLVQRGLFSPVLQDSRFDRFFRDIALDDARSPGTRISAVRCNGAPIAVEISFECKAHVFGYVISHDLEFEKQGLGVVLAEYSIRTAHEQGCAKFDLLAPADAYKMDWADDASIEVADWATPLSHAGALYARLWLGSARQWAKKVAAGLPPRLGRMLSTIYFWAATGSPGKA
jgi:CelD/BcsL family acetyltransferase involved in cellulose biosynthesis